MSSENRIGVFGIGPGSIAAIDQLGPAVVFTRAGATAEKRSIYTTDKGYEDLFSRYVPQEGLMRMSEVRTITKNGSDFTVQSGPNYAMVNYPDLMTRWQQIVEQSGTKVEVLPADTAKRDIKVVEKDGAVEIFVHGGKYEFDSVVDASGTAAVIASQVEPYRKEEDFLTEYVAAGTFRGTVPEGQMTLVFGAANGTSWVNPSIYQGTNGEPLVDVVFSGWGHRSGFDRFRNGDGRARLNHLASFVNGQPGITLDSAVPLDVTYGMIRSQMSPRPSSTTVFATGESGGTARPFSGESFNRALLSGAIAAETIEAGELPHDYYDRFKNQFRGEDLFFSFAYRRLEGQHDGSIGQLMDRMGKWFEGKEDNPKLVAQLEKFVIEGKMPPALMAKLLVNPYYLKTMASTLSTLARVKKHRPENMPVPARYSFAELV